MMLQTSQSAPESPSRATDEIVAILYHHPCPDGAYAALAAWLFYNTTAESNKPRGKSKGLSSFSSSSIRKVDLRFVPIYTTDTDAKKCERVLKLLPEALCSVVYLLDIFGGEALLRTLSTKSRRVHVIDHHKSSYEEWINLNGLQVDNEGDDKKKKKPNPNPLPRNVKATFDMERSGAIMALDHFFPNVRDLDDAVATVFTRQGMALPASETVAQQTSFFGGAESSSSEAANAQENGPSRELRRAFALVQDNDLWRHKMKDSRAFACGLSALSLSYDFSTDQQLFTRLVCAIDVDKVIEEGEKRLTRENLVIEKELEGTFGIDVPVWSKGVSLHDVEIMAVRTEHPGLRSEMGNRLAIRSKGAIAAVVYTDRGVPKGKLKVSLRSVGDVDTTEVSVVYGGGGHRNASSFLISVQVFESWRRSG